MSLLGAVVAPGDVVWPLDADPLTESCLAFFLVEVVAETSPLVPPTVALALAAEPTLAEGPVVWAEGSVVCAGAVGCEAAGPIGAVGAAPWPPGA